MDSNTVKKLAKQLNAHKVSYETAIGIIVRVNAPPNANQMLEWLEQNPNATPKECCRMSRKLRAPQVFEGNWQSPETVFGRIECGDLKSACIFELLDSYYDHAFWRLDDLGNNEGLLYKIPLPFPVELLLPVENRGSGIGALLNHLLNKGHDIDAEKDGYNALKLAVSYGDALMVRFLIQHGADAKSWPGMDDDHIHRNYYLDNIDLMYAYYSSKDFHDFIDTDHLKALHRTALVFSEDALLRPYKGKHCLTIDEDGNVSFGEK